MNLSEKIKSPEVSKWVFLLILVVIVTFITYYKIILKVEYGPMSDTLDLLANAALFAGKGIGYTDLTRPPLISLLTSIFFIFDGLSLWPIFVVDGGLYIFGCIGLYLFFKEHFDSLTSFIGSLLFATFPLVVTFVGVGYNDVSGVAVAIWAIYLTFLAVNNDSKYFFISFPMAMLAFFTRYNMALIVFPIFLYILMNKNKITSFRNVYVGMLFSILLLLPIFIFFHIKFGNFLYPFLSFFKTSGSSWSSEHFAYNPDLMYYLKNLGNSIGLTSLLIIMLTIVGFTVHCLNYFRLKKNSWSLNLNSLKLKFKLPLLFILIIILVLTFGKIHYMVSEVIFFVIAYLIFIIFKDRGIDIDLDMFFFAWFMAFFIFQSVYTAKDLRYFISMYPPLAYFIVKGFNWLVTQMKVKIKEKNITKYFIATVIVTMMLSMVFTQLGGMEETNQNRKLFIEDAMLASDWLINYDPNYNSKIIYADLWSYFAWYLQMDVGRMSVFKNNQKLYAGGIADLNLTKKDKIDLDMELEEIRPDYYISILSDMNFTSYEPIQRVGSVTIFKRIE